MISRARMGGSSDVACEYSLLSYLDRYVTNFRSRVLLNLSADLRQLQQSLRAIVMCE